MSGLTGYLVVLDAALAFGQPSQRYRPSGSSCLACAIRSVDRTKFGTVSKEVPAELFQPFDLVVGLCCLCPWRWAHAASPLGG